jgi:hypothetical protein
MSFNPKRSEGSRSVRARPFEGLVLKAYARIACDELCGNQTAVVISKSSESWSARIVMALSSCMTNTLTGPSAGLGVHLLQRAPLVFS